MEKTITVKNSSGDTVQSVSSQTSETYIVTYKITYKDYTGSVSNKIVIKEKEPTEEQTEEGNN